jgi:catechol 2,3-dioxygenase-like lactoylglutathione lyase family enzyme
MKSQASDGVASAQGIGRQTMWCPTGTPVNLVREHSQWSRPIEHEDPMSEGESSPRHGELASLDSPGWIDTLQTEVHPMTHVLRFDHVGITVADLDSVTAFFVMLGLEVEGRTVVEGEFLDTVIGIPGSRTEIVMLRPPDGGTLLELSSFVRPDHLPGSPAAMANELGLRNVAFEVDDLQTVVDRLVADGYRLVGGVGRYEDAWRMAYVRGPEGIIVSLAERIG